MALGVAVELARWRDAVERAPIPDISPCPGWREDLVGLGSELASQQVADPPLPVSCFPLLAKPATTVSSAPGVMMGGPCP